MKIFSVKIKPREVTAKAYKDYNTWSRQHKDMYRPSHIYIWIEGETIMENLENRRQRPYTTFKKEVVPFVLQELGLSPNTKVRWSRYAGCSCPCSPGFIIDDDVGKDVHVRITADN
jgi:hypothetical protein